jgi:hypothetical protein
MQQHNVLQTCDVVELPLRLEAKPEIDLKAAACMCCLKLHWTSLRPNLVLPTETVFNGCEPSLQVAELQQSVLEVWRQL